MPATKEGQARKEAFVKKYSKEIKNAIRLAAEAGCKPMRVEAVKHIVEWAVAALGYSDKCNVGDVWIWIKNTYKRLDATKKLPGARAKKSRDENQGREEATSVATADGRRKDDHVQPHDQPVC